MEVEWRKAAGSKTTINLPPSIETEEAQCEKAFINVRTKSTFPRKISVGVSMMYSSIFYRIN